MPDDLHLRRHAHRDRRRFVPGADPRHDGPRHSPPRRDAAGGAGGTRSCRLRGFRHCGARFGYFLVHNGFNDSAFAYCDGCGRTALLSAWFDDIPDDAALYHYGPVSVEAEPWLESCECGGAFRANASPRCPGCTCKLSAQEARSWIEANAPGTAKGWRWQGGWHGLYCIVIERRSVEDNWHRRP